MPFFEAGTEKFIRDWKKTVVRIVVRDSALREKDRESICAPFAFPPCSN